MSKFNRVLLVLSALSALACARQPTPSVQGVDEDQSWRSTPPEPLAVRPFVLPEPSRGELSNGIPVVVVENHEVPLVYVRLTMNVGGYTDTQELPGLASVTIDMLNEGAGEMSAGQLSAALRQIGSTLETSAGADGAQIGLESLGHQLPNSLALMASVALEPTFPEEDWDLMRRRRIQDLEADRVDPSEMSYRSWVHLMYGQQYLGNLKNETAYETMGTDDMRAWYGEYFQPSQAMFLVGGDTTLEEILPLLEEHFGNWENTAEPSLGRPGTLPLPEHEGSTIFLVDNPGAAQSVVRAGTFVNSRLDDSYAAFRLANHVIGGQFSARINLNLREDKGWTYGARSSTYHNHLNGLWSVRTNVVTEHTADSVAEIMDEVAAPLGDRPITAEELERARDGLLGTRPLSFEQPNYLLDEIRNINRYGLSEDWLSNFDARFQAVSLEEVRAAWAEYIVLDELTWVIVGDVERIGPELEEIGLPIVRIDSDGIPLP